MRRAVALGLLVSVIAVPTVVLTAGVDSPIAGVTRELSVMQKDAIRTAEDSSLKEIPATETIETPEVPAPIGISVQETIEEPEEQYVIDFTESEFNLMCLVVEAEAGNCSEDCRQLIADTIINRVSEYGSLTEVLYAPKQFTCVWDGGIKRCSVPSESTIRICRQELKQVGHPSVWFFRTKHYFKSLGTPFCEIDGVYFSTR